MQSIEVVEALRRFETDTIVPLVQQIGAQPIRSRDFCLTLVPGDVAFLMNDAFSYRQIGDRIEWSPLSVMYRDQQDRLGRVFGLEASYQADMQPSLEVAEIDGVARIEREGSGVVWRDTVTHRRLLRFRIPNLPMLTNVWHLFVGGVLPVIFQGGYRFVDRPSEQAAFQANMLHQITVAYRGLL